jgi:hypothetical protein
MLALLCACVMSVVGQTPDWSNILPQVSAPRLLDSPPTGCTCADSSSPCTRFDCPCTCNLKARQCDARCCCDPDCSPTEIASYQSSNTCLPNGPQNKSLTKCFDSSAIVYVNAKSRCVGPFCPPPL